MRQETKVRLTVASDNLKRRQILVKIAQEVYDQPEVLDEASSILETRDDGAAHLVLLETDDDLAKLTHIAWSIYHRRRYETPLLLTFASDTSFLQGVYGVEGLDRELLLVGFREAFPHLAHFNWDTLVTREVSRVMRNVLDSLINAEQHAETDLPSQLHSSISSPYENNPELPLIVVAADNALHRERLAAIIYRLSEHTPLVLERHWEVVHVPLGGHTVVFLENHSNVPVLVQTVHAWWRRHQGQAIPRFVAVVTEISLHQNPFMKRMQIEGQHVFAHVIRYEQIDEHILPGIIGGVTEWNSNP
jgi:hypothetical protein